VFVTTVRRSLIAPIEATGLSDGVEPSLRQVVLGGRDEARKARSVGVAPVEHLIQRPSS
jgi:hypothetical protein